MERPREKVSLERKKKNSMGWIWRQYGTGGERKGNQAYGTGGAQNQGHSAAYDHKGRAIISQLEILGMDKVEMGEMRIEMIERDTGILELALKMVAMKRVIQKILMNWR